MRITRIESQKKNPRRKNIYADGEFMIGVSDETLLRAGLRTGDEIDEGRIRALARDEEISGVRKAALRFLSHRPRTAREIRDKLRSEEFGDADIEQTINSLKQSGLVNDADFARMYISDALSAKATGKNLLRRKLLLLGVEKEIVDQALRNAFATVDQEAEALEAGRQFLKKSLATHKPAQPHRIRQRLANFLARRGFSWDTIETVTKTLIMEQEE